LVFFLEFTRILVGICIRTTAMCSVATIRLKFLPVSADGFRRRIVNIVCLIYTRYILLKIIQYATRLTLNKHTAISDHPSFKYIFVFSVGTYALLVLRQQTFSYCYSCILCVRCCNVYFLFVFCFCFDIWLNLD